MNVWVSMKRWIDGGLWSLVAVGLAWFAASASAAEQVVIRFRERPQTQGNVVRLEELVEFVSGQGESLEKLKKMPLGPAPRPNAPQTWQHTDVLQHLQLRGVHPSSIRWSGPTTASLHRVDQLAAETDNMMPAFLQERTIRQASQLVAQAISEYISYKTGERVDWQIKVFVPDRYIARLQTKRNIVSIGGGREPWEGEQEFVLQIREGTGMSSLKVRAEVALPPMVVTASRPLRRDEVLTEKALSYAPLPKRSQNSDKQYFTDIDDLVGKQVRRAISTGLPIEADYVGEPILIARNSLVRVESVAGSIVVSSQARSLGSGAKGDLIEIELLSTRDRLYATVIDALTVRIAAQASRTIR